MVDHSSSNYRPSVPDPGEPIPNERGDSASPPKILYIEGHSALRDVFAQLLDLQSGYQIEVAPTGVEGVEKAKSWQPDVILMGLRLPLLDGYEAIQVIRDHPGTATIPIIVISAWSSATHKQRALALGADEHITPPIDTHRLLRRINRYLKLRRQQNS